MQLIRGTSRASGLLKVKGPNDLFGPVCGRGFDDTDASESMFECFAKIIMIGPVHMI